MKLFTPRFIKDIFLIILFGVLLYSLTHNPIVKPRAPQIKGAWSIQLMQHPLVFGVAGHNYLTLRNESNAVQKELHGLATDSATGEWKYYGTDKSDLLKVWEFSSDRNYIAKKDYPGVLLFKGTKEEVGGLWTKALICGEDINNQNIPYPPYGFDVKGDTENSNSVAYTLTLCMGLDAKHIGLLTPGWGNNLLSKQLAKISDQR
jgi:hypothetical protein